MCRLDEAVHPSLTEPLLAIIPSHPSLGRYDTGRSGRPDVELKLVASLYDAFAPQQGHRHFDWIILDTPPNVSLFTRAALAAADYILVPARARNTSVRGILNKLQARHAMGALMGRVPKLLGGVLTHWGEHAASLAAEQRLNIIFCNEGTHLLQAKIPLSRAIESNPSRAWSARRAYNELDEEVAKQVGHG